MEKRNIQINGAKILIMGLTFKENCADIRNSGVENVIKKLQEFNCNLDSELYLRLYVAIYYRYLVAALCQFGKPDIFKPAALTNVLIEISFAFFINS